MNDQLTARAERQSKFRRSDLQRPPWATEIAIRKQCTGCGDCIRKCPENILFSAYAGTPALDFNAGECTFCGACAEACNEDVFAPVNQTPWDVIAVIQPGCMLEHGIGCQLCTDSCDQTALRLDLSQRPVGRIVVDTESCSGCGACLPVCPVGAISVRAPTQGMPNG